MVSYQDRHNVKSQNCFENILLNLKELIRKNRNKTSVQLVI